MAGYGISRLIDYYYREEEEKQGPDETASLMAAPKESKPLLDTDSYETTNDPYAFLGRYAKALRNAFETEEEFVDRYSKDRAPSIPDLSSRVAELQDLLKYNIPNVAGREIPAEQGPNYNRPTANEYYNEEYFKSPEPMQVPESPEAPKGLFTRPTVEKRPKLKPGSYTPDFDLNVPEDAMKDKAFLSEVSRVSNKLNIREDDLLKAIQFETAGSFDPAQKSGTSNAVGLIQFMPNTAKGLGTTTEKLAKMPRAKQMKYVEKHLSMFLTDPDKEYDFGDLYMAIHWPAGVGKSNDYVMYEKGSKQYRANKGLDLDKNGKVTKGETVYRALQSK